MSLRAGGQHEFSCVAFGSRPAAALTWWFDQTVVTDGMDGVHVVSYVEVKHSDRSNIPAFLNLLRSRKNYIRAFISSTRTKSVNMDYLSITFLNSCHFPFIPRWRKEPNVLPGRELPKVCLT